MHSDILEGMTSHEPLPRSPELMSTSDCALLVVDVQEKVIRLVPGFRSIIWNITRLVDAARLLDLSVAATEHYPKGLGSTVPDLAARLGYVAKHDRAGLVDGYTDVMKGLQCLLRSLDGPKPKWVAIIIRIIIYIPIQVQISAREK